ncbi:hypothetical protein APSETT445_009458 [Aspergillus pseudonomiae]
MGSIGLEYSGPTLDTSQAGRPRDIVDSFLQQHPNIDYVRFQWVDYAGVLRARVATKAHFDTIVKSNKPLSCGQVTFSCLPDGSRVPFEPCAVHLLHPDWKSLRVISTSSPGHDSPSYASVMCSIVQKLPGVAPDPDLCPRIALENTVAKAHNQHGIDFLIGFEIEFVVLQDGPDGCLIPFSSHPGTYSAAALRGPSYRYFEECMRNLLDSGIEVREFHAEGSIGQYEVTLAARPPLEAIDELVSAHDIIRTTFANHGLTATMSPKPVMDRQANGSHIHVSIHPPQHEEAFLAGLLSRLPAICSLSMASIASYDRHADFLAGTVVAWGSQNRQVPVRKMRPGYWEIRCADAMANMYLAVAGILAAGLLGKQNNEPLRWNDASYAGSAQASSDKLPANLEQSLSQLKRVCGELSEMLGSRIPGHYLDFKQHEVEALKNLDGQRLRQLLARLV